MNIEQKKAILEGKGRLGGRYCEAIDEDPYNPDEWANRMPASGYTFRQQEGAVTVRYNHVFACYDGWDSHDEEYGTYPTMTEAVETIWEQENV